MSRYDKKKIDKYILDAIDPSGYEVTAEKDVEKLLFLHDTFIAEYGWHVEQVGFYNALTGWLQGLPSSISIAFYNHDILELAVLWGSLPDNATEKQEDKILEKYWQFMAMRIQQLFRQYKIIK